MTDSPAQVIQTLLANPTNLQHVRSVTTPDVTYVSLSEDNPAEAILATQARNLDP
jgi:hypothetical protein